LNFFEHQEQARRQSRRLVFLFVLAVVAIVAAIDGILLLAVGASNLTSAEVPLTAAELLRGNLPLLAGGALATLSVIGLASLFRVTSLRAGGGQVARQIGGTLVDSDTRDAKRRRLRNVVEEIALASGVPVPEIYVLEQESGINAFAAGYSPSDAAVAVTRGALEKLDRNELQGVIAHEFSHILNGDMRINIRLMGTLFGILLLAMIGRRVLIHSHFAGRSRDKNGAAVLLIAFGLMAVGYIGLFFGRWIKAAVSRQREYLADASAVQFTREPDGIAGALKKIAVYSEGSFLDADSEEISHMLFGDGRRMALFSTHPPLNDRIGRIEPGFRPEDLDRLAAEIKHAAIRRREQAERRKSREDKPSGPFDAERIIGGIGRAEWQQILAAAALAAAIPKAVSRAARSTEWAPEVLFYTLLDADRQIREQQLLIIARTMGSDSEVQVRALLEAGNLPSAEQRLPLLEIAFPALKRHPAEFISRVLDTVNELILVDGRTDVFEFLLARLVSLHLVESRDPQRIRLAGKRSLAERREAALVVAAVLARHGHDDPASARAAFDAGLEVLPFGMNEGLPATADWVDSLDSALPQLDELTPAGKETLIRALTAIVLKDGRLRPSELELLRVVCWLIHVPMPVVTA
jgi:Zn-dependent protease with chaperone function